MAKVLFGTFILWLVLNGRIGKFVGFATTPATPPEKTPPAKE